MASGSAFSARVLGLALGLLLLVGCQSSPPPPPAPPTPPSDTSAPAPVDAPAEVDSAPTGEETAALGDFTSLATEGVSPHLEQGENGTFRLFYSSITAGGLVVAECTSDFSCSTSTVLDRMADLTVVTTGSGERRGYWVEMNPDTKNKEIYTGLISEDGTSVSGGVSLGFSNEGQMGWGVPDAVTLEDGRVRLYWVVSGEGRAQERVVSATSTDNTGTAFVDDGGFRFTGGYVDFEVLDATEGNWVAVMSSSPESLPDSPQGIFVATSPDGVEWSTSGVNIAPVSASYLDPTGVENADGSYTLVVAVAPNAIGLRDYDLQVTTLTLGSP